MCRYANSISDVSVTGDLAEAVRDRPVLGSSEERPADTLESKRRVHIPPFDEGDRRGVASCCVLALVKLKEPDQAASLILSDESSHALIGLVEVANDVSLMDADRAGP